MRITWSPHVSAGNLETLTGRVLAIDAHPSSNLHLVLWLTLPQTVGGLREEARAGVLACRGKGGWITPCA